MAEEEGQSVTVAPMDKRVDIITMLRNRQSHELKVVYLAFNPHFIN